jgi:PhzF family phenazine biosynthesis protein
MATFAFRQVDVFASAPLSGNPLAVVHDADGLSEAQMQAFARWTALSETTFLLAPTAPGADYRVRIFTPSRELPFAGHPTLGSAHAWLANGGRPAADGAVTQQCGAGLVPVRVHSGRLAFAAPPLTRYQPVAEELLQQITRGLGLQPGEVLDASWLVNGPEWIGLRLASAEQVLAVQPDAGVLGHLELGLVGPHPAGGEVQFEVRGLLPGDGVEDPVTGSLNAGLAQWLIDSGQAPDHYVAAQGGMVGAAGRVHVDRREDGLWVGGQVRTVVTGTVEL